MHRFGPKMQSKKLSTRHVMLNPIGPNTPLQARVLASSNPFTESNHFEEGLPKDNGLLRDLLENMIEIEVLLDGGGGST